MGVCIKTSASSQQELLWELTNGTGARISFTQKLRVSWTLEQSQKNIELNFPQMHDYWMTSPHSGGIGSR